MNQKAVSPGRLVLRRFLRNRLALVGLGILLFMVLFSFLGPVLYPYGQTEVFRTYKTMNADYASVGEQTTYQLYPFGDQMLDIPTGEQLEKGLWTEEDRVLTAEKRAEGLYAVGEAQVSQGQLAGVYNSKLRVVSGQSESFSEAVSEAVTAGERLLLYEETVYLLKAGKVPVETEVYQATLTDSLPLAMASLWHFEGYDDTRQAALLDQRGIAGATRLVIRDATGEDTLPPELKEKIRNTLENMDQTGEFSHPLPALDGSGELVETAFTVHRRQGGYTVTCTQKVYLLDRYAPPSKAHLLGTDGDGMDVLARMMAGGRISLMVGFAVVLLEVFLGMVLGGLAGYFGGWVDSLLMRLVDVFYCIPSMPILIILGAMFDAIRMTPYVRLFWLMAVLGFLGWASIARLVRGQILSLREQEFMVAAEAAGLPASRRIFRHLIPNVMPQLIVTATMGLGSVILTESTLSFLGLGVKHPMATWGTMINSVAKSAETMMKYTHIWLPVGLLICLTVIAFNFVGDGLRDALDPKMKR